MSAIKVLVTGAAGQYGTFITKEFTENFDFLGTYHSNKSNLQQNVNYINLDIENFDKTNSVINDFKPNFVLHAACFANPQQADAATPKQVYNTNVNATINIAKACDKVDARLIFLSTDLVYAGYRGSMLKENAKLIPASLYAETKLMAELKIQSISSNFTILRNSLMYGIMDEQSASAFNKLYYALKNGNKFNLFTDQFRTPLSFSDGARLLKELIIKINYNNSILLNDIANFGGKERVSRSEMGDILCDEAELDKSLINRISISEFTNIAQVPDVSMNTEKIQNIGLSALSVRESIKEILTTINR